MANIIRWSILFVCLLLAFTSSCFAVDVKDFGAKGDGKTDDTKAIIAAIQGARDGLVEFSKGDYLINKTIEVNLSSTGGIILSGKGGNAVIKMNAEGPAFRFIGTHAHGSSDPITFDPITLRKERMPLVEGLEIRGNHAEADGLEFVNTMQTTLHAVLIRNVRTGLLFTSRNRNILINACHIYQTSGIGIHLNKVNIHQMIISGSHISYCKQGGIRVDESEIRNFQITGNDIEYNCDPNGKTAADIWIDCSKAGSVREGTIASNTIQAIPSPGGANIRFSGSPENPNNIGMWSITGNHISNQETIIKIDQARAISITGNTFIRGYDRHIQIDNSQNIVLNGNIFDHNDDYFPKDLIAHGGVSMNRTKNVIVSDNIIDGSGYGDEKFGGAITVQDCEEVSLIANQIRNPLQHGVFLLNSHHVLINNCRISNNQGSMVFSGITVDGDCRGGIITGNSVQLIDSKRIINHAKDVIIKDNY